MGLILNIETATKNCSVSVSRDADILAIKELNEGQFSHAEKLHSFILEVILAAKVNKDELDAIAVSMGPGSYTGLRIGISTAKGLCYALDIPLISISTLKSMASQISLQADEYVIPLLDARRMEVYSAVFNHGHEQVVETKAEIIDASSFSEFLEKGKVYFLGDGAKKCIPIVTHANAEFLLGNYPSSKEMAALADEKYNNSQFEDVAYFEPFYLKDFVAGKPKKLF